MNPSRFFLRGFVCLDYLISGSLALRLEPAGCPLACTAVLVAEYQVEDCLLLSLGRD